MAEERVTLIVEGRDQAKAMLEGLGGAITGVNQALEIAKKGFEIFKLLITDNVAAMVEYRGELDPVAKEMRRLADETAYARAVAFDVLTPIILGLGDAFRDAGNGMVDYINTNRQLIATNITEFLAEVARILVEGVSQGVLWASRAVSGLIEAWNLLSAAVETAIGETLSGMEALLEGMADFAEWADDDALAKTWREAAASVGELGDVFSESADASMAKVEEQIAKQKEFETALQAFKAVAVDFVGEAEAAVLERIAAGWQRVKQHTEQATDAVQNQREAWSSLEVSAADYYQRVADLSEKSALWQQQQSDQIKNLEVQNANIIAGAIGQIGNAWTQVALAAMASSKEIAKAVVVALIDSIIIAINAIAAMAAARAFAANQDFPIVGVAIGLAAAAAASAIAKGFLADVPKAAFGGIARGGTPGQDSIPMLVQEDEGILQRGQTALFKRLANVLEATQRQPTPSAMAGRGETHLHVEPRSVVPPQSAELNRSVKHVMRANRWLQSRGM